MRQALGLIGSKGTGDKAPPKPDGARQATPRVPQQRADAVRGRHRFVQDGGVPVVVVNHRPDDATFLKEKLAETERLLGNERAAHNETRRALADAKAESREAATRLAHAGLAHQEALNVERRALASAQRALNEALTRVQVPARRVVRPAEIPAPELDIPEPAPAIAKPAAAEAAPKKRGRPRVRPLPEPKPVRWWTPSYRSKTKA